MTTTLARAAESTSRYFGTAIDAAKLSDQSYTAIASREFDLATATGTAIELTEPQQGVFDFTQGDEIVAWAAKSGMRVRGHGLLQFSNALPGWWANLGTSTMRQAMLDHVKAVVAHYSGPVAYWDVVSEAFAADGSRRQTWFQSTGDDWISTAFGVAYEADRAAKLCYDESGIESWSAPKTQAVFAMVRDLKARGVRIDCVGIKGHFTASNPVPIDLGTTIANFASLGVEVALTELDSTGAQPTDYAAAIQACLAVPGCAGVSVSGVRDGDAPNSSDQPLLFDAAGDPKPAYAAALSAFSPCGGGSCTPSYALNVTKAGTGTGTVTSSVGALSCGSACTASFPSGTGVILTATPAARSVFSGWSGGGCSGPGVCLVSMTAAQNVTATFEAPPTLQAAAEAKGRFFGTSIGMGKLDRDSLYTALANLQFDMVSPENVLWLEATEPRQNSFSFGNADLVVEWALQNGKRVTGGPLLHYSGQPGWLANFSGATLRAAILNHVDVVVKHFQGKVAYWVVTSEAFNDSTGARRQSNLQRTGDDWIEAAFATARAADPSAKLCYGDYNIENWSWLKTQGVYAMVKDFKARGVPIDCVSLESHFTGGASVPPSFQTTIESFAALGVEVHLGELDVTNASTSEYAAAVKACMAVQGCTGITVWGVRDSDSWRSSESPLLFDAKGQAKPAFYAVLDAINGVTTFPLTVTKQGSWSDMVTSSPGGISCGSSCSGVFPSGTTVTLTASSSSSVFAGWGGACSGTSPTCTVTADAAKTVTASFTPTHAVVVRKWGSGSGRIVSSPAGVDCGETCTAWFVNGKVDLTAIPDAGSEFMGWPDCPGSLTCSVSINGQDEYVSPNFELTAKPTLTVTKTGDGVGWVGSSPAGIACGSTCSAEYAWRTQVTLTAAGMDDSSGFAGWSGACTGTGPCTVTMSESRSVIAFFTRGDLTPPSTPRGLGSTVSSTAVTLTWTASTDNVGVVGYDVFNGTELAGTVSTPSARISNLSPGATYVFAVRARDAAGNVSGRSEPLAVTTLPDVDLTPPSAPANLAWTSADLTVTLSWGASTDEVGVVGYDLWYGSFFLGTFSDTTLALIGFKPGAQYVFTVKARDAAGNVSAASNQITVLLTPPADTTPPSAPTNVKAANVSGTSVRLSWTASTDDVGVVVYQVYAGAAVVGTVLASTSATISSLTPGKTYAFTVTARDAAGNVSAASSAVSVTTAAIAP